MLVIKMAVGDVVNLAVSGAQTNGLDLWHEDHPTAA